MDQTSSLLDFSISYSFDYLTIFASHIFKIGVVDDFSHYFFVLWMVFNHYLEMMRVLELSAKQVSEVIPFWARLNLPSFAYLFIPRPNPDFFQLKASIVSWWLELDEEGHVIREIGFDSSRRPVLLSPFGRNIGFIARWGLKFEIPSGGVEIIKEDFEKYWKELEASFEELRNLSEIPLVPRIFAAGLLVLFGYFPAFLTYHSLNGIFNESDILFRFYLFLIFLACALVTSFFAILFIRAIKGQGRKRDGKLMPDFALKSFYSFFGVIGSAILVKGVMDENVLMILSGFCWLAIVIGRSITK